MRCFFFRGGVGWGGAGIIHLLMHRHAECKVIVQNFLTKICCSQNKYINKLVSNTIYEDIIFSMHHKSFSNYESFFMLNHELKRPCSAQRFCFHSCFFLTRFLFLWKRVIELHYRKQLVLKYYFLGNC